MTERLTLTDAVDALKGLYGLLQLRNASDPGWESNHRAVDARRVMALAEAHGTAPLPETQPREGDDHPGTIAPLKGDTPRTDAKVFSVTIAGGNHNVVFAEDARQLERELAEAKRELEAETALATRTMVERDALERRLAVSAKPLISPGVINDYQALAEKAIERIADHHDDTTEALLVIDVRKAIEKAVSEALSATQERK